MIESGEVSAEEIKLPGFDGSPGVRCLEVAQLLSALGREKRPAEPLSSAYRCAADAVLIDWGRDMKSSTFAALKEGECE